jgi:hypothetical protein
MRNQIDYNGYTIEATTRPKGKPEAWTLEVRITPKGRRTGARLCRAPNIYPTEELAVERCLEFGRRIIDGKARRKAEPTN